MEYVNFGAAGVKVSPIALGMGLRGQGSAKEAERLVNHAIDSGVNLIDCANIYGLGDDRRVRGTSEEVLGRVLKNRRDEVVVTTKVHSPVAEGPNDSGASRYAVMREMDRSLKRLQTDHVDVYLLHAYPESSPLEETLRALDDLVDSGKVHYIGCSNYYAWQIAKANGIADRCDYPRFISAQHMYNLLRRDVEREILPACGDQGMGMLCWSPLGGGMLTGKYRKNDGPAEGSRVELRSNVDLPRYWNDDSFLVIDELLAIAGEVDKSPIEVALAWLLHQEQVLPIPGVKTAAQMRDVAGAAGLELDPAQVERLDQASARYRTASRLISRFVG